MFENLSKPLIFLDIEATGLHVIRDRIVQLAMLKYLPGKPEPLEFNQLVNPGLPISEEAMAVHGITPADVANKPTFVQVARQVAEFIGDADLAGFNSDRFDIPMLMEELSRAGIEFEMEGRKTIDVQRIFYKMEPRTLGAAYKYYCGGAIENAHNAMADVEATVAVLKGQLDMYRETDYVTSDDEVIRQPVRESVDALHNFTSDLKMLDATQKLKVGPNGEAVFNFGKYLNKPVAETLHRDKQYYQWILNMEFSQQVKNLVKKLVREYENGKDSK